MDAIYYRIGENFFELKSMTRKDRVCYDSLMKKLPESSSFTLGDISLPHFNHAIRYLFFAYFGITLYRGRWRCCSDTKRRLSQILWYYNEQRYPSNETMLKYANMELEERKQEHQRCQASKSSVCTPVDATSNGAAAMHTEEADVESIDSILENAELLLEEIHALTAEIKKGLGSNSDH